MLSFASSLSFNIEMHKPILMCLLSALKLFENIKMSKRPLLPQLPMGPTATSSLPPCFVLLNMALCSHPHAHTLTYKMYIYLSCSTTNIHNTIIIVIILVYLCVQKLYTRESNVAKYIYEATLSAKQLVKIPLLNVRGNDDICTNTAQHFI